MKCNILIVDDDDLFRTMLKEMISLKGYQVTEAANGRSALDLCREQNFEVVITDILMSEFDGLETIWSLRLEHPQTEIIAMSGGGWAAPEDYLAEARDLGVSKTFVKPFNYDALSSAVDDLTSQALSPKELLP